MYIGYEMKRCIGFTLHRWLAGLCIQSKVHMAYLLYKQEVKSIAEKESRK